MRKALPDSYIILFPFGDKAQLSGFSCRETTISTDVDASGRQLLIKKVRNIQHNKNRFAILCVRILDLTSIFNLDTIIRDTVQMDVSE